LDNHIVITVDGHKHILEEPKKILVKNNRIVFCYGHDKNEDDVEFCGERFDVKWGEDIRQSIGRARRYREFVLTIEEKKREEV
jgi:S-adenosylhomocysteine hydrolase